MVSSVIWNTNRRDRWMVVKLNWSVARPPTARNGRNTHLVLTRWRPSLEMYSHTEPLGLILCCDLEQVETHCACQMKILFPWGALGTLKADGSLYWVKVATSNQSDELHVRVCCFFTELNNFNVWPDGQTKKGNFRCCLGFLEMII